jgi:hypothetical protein
MKWACALSIRRHGALSGTSIVVNLDVANIGKARQAGFEYAKRLIDERDLRPTFA